jgi:hypothetical protein
MWINLKFNEWRTLGKKRLSIHKNQVWKDVRPSFRVLVEKLKWMVIIG